MAKKYCYLFSEGNAKMRELLGGHFHRSVHAVL